MKVSELIAELSKLDGATEVALALQFDEDEFDVYEIGAIEVMEDDNGNAAILLIGDAEYADEDDEDEAGDLGPE